MLDFAKFMGCALLGVATLIALIVGANYFVPLTQDDAAFVKPRAEKFYSERGFRIVGEQGYNMLPIGRCYWYTLERNELLYQSCLLRWGSELHEYNLRGVGVPALEK